MSDPERPEAGEPTEGGERTPESEIKANVEFWKDLGVEVDEADVRAKIEELPEVEGFDWYFYIPQGVKASEIWQKMDERFPTWEWGEIGNPDTIKSPRSNQNESYAIIAHCQQEPDKNTLLEKAKSGKDWEKTADQFMSPLERMIAEIRWNQKQGSHLDLLNATLCPGSRTRDERVPYLYYYYDRRLVDLGSHHYGYHAVNWGVRRVITKDTKV